MSTRKPKILIYDIETTLLKVWTFRFGEQSIRHGQLDLKSKWVHTHIICAAYKWHGEKTVHCVDWDYKKQDSSRIIKELHKRIKEADMVIGKNNKRFDDKHFNFLNFLFGGEPDPDWSRISEDLEKQLRKHFACASYSLDYLSMLSGLGGKNPMEFSDWVNIQDQTPGKGEKAFKKMIKYCKKDVDDTDKLLTMAMPYIDLNFNMALFLGEDEGCKRCGSTHIGPNDVYTTRSGQFQRYRCLDCRQTAGRRRIGHDGKLGKFGP